MVGMVWVIIKNRMVWSFHEVDGRAWHGAFEIDVVLLRKGVGDRFFLCAVELGWTGLDQLDKGFGSQCYGFGYDTPLVIDGLIPLL